ncbi:MAG: glucose 1-dehydrogenase [Burkholderiales bacterium]|nr:glucose 1-dehydrogenase [Burkholderiales bacterium]
MSPSLSALFSLAGRVAVVTGGNSGLGRTVAQTLAAAGADVVVVGRDRARCEATVRAIEADGHAAAWVDCDLSHRAGLDDHVVRFAKPFGMPDILVNAAGINPRPPIEALDAQTWDRTLEVNLTVPFLLAQAVAPTMAQRGWGRILNFASLQSVRAFGRSGAYGVSKAGVAQLTRVLAEGWSPRGVNVNAIAPGFFPTPMTQPVFDDPARAQALAARTMIGRNGAPDDVRGAAVFLASRASDYVTGQVLFVDGGFSAG